MFKQLRALALGFGLFTLACGGPVDEDNPPPTVPPDDPPGNIGNVWIVGEVSTCSNYDLLAFISKDTCARYKGQPVVLEYGPACLEWHIGIGGPYSFPGAEWMKFQCQIR